MMIAVDANGWKLWFIQLSGWPVFLIVVGTTASLMLAASVGFTWLSRHSPFRAMAIVLAGLAILAAIVLLALALLTHRLI